MAAKKKGIHIHLYHWQLFALVFLLITILAIFGIYQTNFYAFSVHRNEIKELQQQTVPQDIKGASVATSSASESFFPQQTFRVPILMYHYVEYVKDKGDTIRISLNITPFTFEEEIKTLIGAGYTFMTNAELADVLDKKTTLPAKPILLTFDDGYRDFYTDVLPILKKYHVKATAYIIPGFLNKPNNLLDDQVKDIVQSGLVEIGAHTVHHVWLKGRSLKDVTDEVSLSKTMLEQQFHIAVVSFAYPYGAFDSQAVRVVKSVGFTSAVSTAPGIQESRANRFFLFRLRPGGRTGQALLDFLDKQTFQQ